ncbi:SH3 domain-containing YSC84-like protein 1 [Ptychodera flava]|uniref:SH3 domain-containing YSC84-like protein 1 n=1 Tax=Ptychodera flava TaxID=63121 RepID=UPI003969F118
MVHSPFPKKLKSECKKAAKILEEFTVPSSKVGPDKIIPAGIIMNCYGVAVITVVKAAFLLGARGGSGLVVAKLDRFLNKWSAPSAIGLVGIGGGFEIGAEVTDFIFILNTQSAVDAFSKGGNLTLGANFSVAAGPMGRSVEGDLAARSATAIYTYSKTKGLYAGISLEGAGLIERKSSNAKLYGMEIRAVDILGGKIPPPPEADVLYESLNSHISAGKKAALKMAEKEARKRAAKELEKQGVSESTVTRWKNMSFRSKDKKKSSDAADGGNSSPGTSSAPSSPEKRHSTYRTTSTTKSTYSTKVSRSQSTRSTEIPSYRKSQSSLTTIGASEAEWNRAPQCKAMYNFTAILPCDLTFKKGDVIELLTRTDTQDDWWEGNVHGKTGIFPANYVKVM